MKVCIYGAGAVGGHLAGRLANGGADVSLVARGDHLKAIQANGLQVDTREGMLHSRPMASEDPGTLGPQDFVIVAVKAPALGQVARGIAPLLGTTTSVVFVMNGIPWWYFHKEGGAFDGKRLDRVDPDGVVWDSVGPERAIGGIAHTACTVISPGVVRVANPKNRFVFGRPDGHAEPRLDEFGAILRAGGVDVDVTSRIRDAIWEKLLMNLVGGSLGILTASPMGEALATPAVAAAAKAIANEAVAIARALGSEPGDPAGGLSRLMVSTHKQSILQDLELGRSMEIDALLATPLELARLTGVSTPTADLIVELAMQRARAAGLYTG